jgi:transposase
MSTKMDEDDWAHTLAVFRACLPRRGRKVRDDRRFLEALHFFTVENVLWRALPERFGPWNSVWKRFDRLSKAGVFEAFLRHARVHEFYGAPHSDVRLDRRARSCVGGRSKRGQEGQALGRSRGGFTTKIHSKSDASGDIIAFDLTGGEAPDGRHFETLLDIGPDIQPRAVICDKPRRSEGARHRSRHPSQGKRKEQGRLLRAHPLQSPRPASSRASDGSSASSGSPSDAKRPPKTSGQSSVSPPAYA